VVTAAIGLCLLTGYEIVKATHQTETPDDGFDHHHQQQQQQQQLAVNSLLTQPV